MDEISATRSVEVKALQGLHMRPATLFIETACRFDSKIEIIKDGVRVGTASVIDIMLLAAERGTQLVLEATGHDAEAALDALAAVFEEEFNEDNYTDQQRQDQSETAK